MARAYRKKPVTVEAVQWTGENHAEMCEFIDPEVFKIIPRVGLVIHTLEGDHHASPGDYIIKGVNGEFYPCKPDIFVKTYESATLTPPNEWVSVENALPPAGGRNMKRYSESLEQWEQEAYYDGYGADCGGRGNWRNPFCQNCGRAMTPEAWAELEKRMGGAAMPEPPEVRG